MKPSHIRLLQNMLRESESYARRSQLQVQPRCVTGYNNVTGSLSGDNAGRGLTYGGLQMKATIVGSSLDVVCPHPQRAFMPTPCVAWMTPGAVLESSVAPHPRQDPKVFNGNNLVESASQEGQWRAGALAYRVEQLDEVSISMFTGDERRELTDGEP
jgi:hypothetical protein